MTTFSLHLDQFQGPLELLVHLVQRREVNPSTLEIVAIIHAFLAQNQEDTFEASAEFILLASQIALLKSRALLPRQKREEDEGLTPEEDSSFDIIHHLIDYCRFKEAAETFSKLEIKQEDFYPRGIKEPLGEHRLPVGLSGITLEELSGVFQEALRKAASQYGKVEEETFRVQDKILSIRSLIHTHESLPFLKLFESASGRGEMIVIFLAILELIKTGDIKVTKVNEEITLHGT